MEINDKNGDGRRQNPENQENVRLKRLLQKAVKKDYAPQSLREKIGRMIRE